MAKTISDRFLAGAMYAPFCRTEAAPMSEWEKDLQNMADAGFTCVHGFAEWHDIEYKKGVYDFTKIDHMIGCAAKCGLVAIVNIATQNSVGFYSPRWLMEEYRGHGDGFVDAKGTHMLHGQFEVPCIDDPFYQKYASAFLAACAGHFAGDPRVGGYVLWGEPTLSRYDGSGMICYCEHTVRKFRVWLREKYGSIEALNGAWGTEGPSDFADFDQVCPPSGFARQMGGFVSWDDFRSFMEDDLAGHIANADRIFKENGATQPTVVEMMAGIQSGVDPWKIAKCTDIIGISCFGNPDRQTALHMNLAGSMAKATGRSTFVIEALGGSVKFLPARSPSAEFLKSTLMQRAAYGTRGLMYWCWRPRVSDTEGNDFGMTRPNGKVRRKTLDTGAFAKEMQTYDAVYAASERKADAAIFMSQSIVHLMDAEYMHENYVDAITGAHHMLLDMHVGSDFITEEQIIGGQLSRYKVLLLPCSYIMSEACAAAIGAYVKGGGTVIADCYLAEKRIGGLCYTELPGGGLNAVFGVDKDDILVHEASVGPNTLGIRTGTVTEILDIGTAAVTETYRDLPAVTENTCGAGRAVCITSQFFAAYARRPERALRERLAALLGNCGVTPFMTLGSADASDGGTLFGTAMHGKATGELSVLTFVNGGAEAVEDEATFADGDYAVLPHDARVTLTHENGMCHAHLALGAWESAALIRK